MSANKNFTTYFSSELADYFEDAIQAVTDESGGVEIYYIPHNLIENVNESLFNQVINRTYTKMFNIKLIAEDFKNIRLNSDVFNRFGFNLKEDATFFISRREFKSRWQEIDKDDIPTEDRWENVYIPQVGDLLYIPLIRVFLEVTESVSEENLLMGYKAWFKIVCIEYQGKKSDDIEIDIETGDEEEKLDIINKIEEIKDSIKKEYLDHIDPDETGFDPSETKSKNDEIEKEARNFKDRDESSNDLSDMFGGF
jgi:hypothetical protein